MSEFLQEKLLDYLGPDIPQLLQLRIVSHMWSTRPRSRVLSAARHGIIHEIGPRTVRAVMWLGVAASCREDTFHQIYPANKIRAETLDIMSMVDVLDLIKESAKDQQQDVRYAAMNNLAFLITRKVNLKEEIALRGLDIAAASLEDQNWLVRWAAVDVVKQVGGRFECGIAKANEVLTIRLKDMDWPVRRATIGGLLHIFESRRKHGPGVPDQHRLVKSLIPLKEDCHSKVREAAKWALVQLAEA